VVPVIRALRERFAQVADIELQKTLDALSRREHTPAQQREAVQQLVRLVVNKLLHQPTTALRESQPDEASLRAEVLSELFGLDPSEYDRDSNPTLPESVPESESPKAKAVT